MAFILKDTWEILKLDRLEDLEPTKVEVIQCDDLIAPLIRLLNMNGYKTAFSCSGHMYNNCAIKFGDKDTYQEYCENDLTSVRILGHQLNEDIEMYQFIIKNDLSDWYIGFYEDYGLSEYIELFKTMGIECDYQSYFVPMEEESKMGITLRKRFDGPEDFSRMKKIIEFNEQIYNDFETIIAIRNVDKCSPRHELLVDKIVLDSIRNDMNLIIGDVDLKSIINDLLLNYPSFAISKKYKVTTSSASSMYNFIIEILKSFNPESLKGICDQSLYIDLNGADIQVFRDTLIKYMKERNLLPQFESLFEKKEGENWHEKTRPIK